MRATVLFLSALFVISAGAMKASGQVIIRIEPNANSQPVQLNDGDENHSLISEVFGSITEELNLTDEQITKLEAIVNDTLIRADPLLVKLDHLSLQMDRAALARPFDERLVRQLSTQQATLLSQIIVLKTNAKAKMYRLLTPEQQAVVARKFNSRPVTEAALGALAN